MSALLSIWCVAPPGCVTAAGPAWPRTGCFSGDIAPPGPGPAGQTGWGPRPTPGSHQRLMFSLFCFLWNVVEKYVLCDCPSTVKSPVSKQSLLAADLQILFSSDMCCKSLEMDHLIVIIHITDKKQLMASSYQLPGGGRNFVPNIQLFQCCIMNRAIM